MKPCSAITVRILGCGSSGGVPRIGGEWGACDPANPMNRRSRCSALLTGTGGGDGLTRVLIDTGPDMRCQLLDAGVDDLDAVIYTHDHADHIHGIDDLRVLAQARGSIIPVWFTGETGMALRQRFGYCFSTPEGSPYPPIIQANHINVQENIVIDGQGGRLEVTPLPVAHGSITALGFRVGPLVYMPDVSHIPPATAQLMQGMHTWIIDALRHRRHGSHFSLGEALDWIARLAPVRAVLTNLHVDLDYNELLRLIPENTVPAHDGMELTCHLPQGNNNET